MRIAVSDACIFIDVIELKLTSQLFSLPLEIHTTIDVFNELYPDQQELLKAYQTVGKLSVHNITPEERYLIIQEPFPRALSDTDKTVLFLAGRLNAIVLSSDKAIRNYAKSKVVEYHGMLWILDTMLDEGLLTPVQATDGLKALIEGNIIYQGNRSLIEEMNKRLRSWSRKSL
ncbi:MAG: hypothetical protein M3512_16540 [Bacteroidota bacterium]|jgi:hypothetical protein|nr:hypothetical protein [Bacteroidota bacterium]